MSRLSSCYEKLRAENKKALVPYIVVGDPDIETSLELMHAMVKAGANIIELGVPFSDPMAEGPSIQLAHERALKHNTSLKDVLTLVKKFREKDQDTPVLLMGYLNPYEIFGYDALAVAANNAGVDAFLVVDLPPEEAADFKAACSAFEIDLIFLIAPTTTQARMQAINAQASGFIYYVSLKGVTGAGHIDLEEVENKVSEIKGICELPVNVGFGIKDADSAAQLSNVADGVIVGSKLVDQCVKGDREIIIKSITDILKDMRQAIDSAN